MNKKTETQLAIEQAGKRLRKLISCSTTASLGVMLVALGVLMTVPRANAAPSVCTDDCNFIQSAAQGGMTEVKLGELASTSGQRDDVKEFGHKMVKDHTSIDDNLKALAAKKGVTLSDRLDSKHQEIVDKMSALSGSDFDNAYITCMIKDHKQDAKSFKSESSATKDTDVKSFVDTTIPVVQEHLRIASAMKN
jgi:putative membrane protein